MRTVLPDVIVRFRVWLGQSQGGKLMDCFNCLSLWFAAPAALFVSRRPLEWGILLAGGVRGGLPAGAVGAAAGHDSSRFPTGRRREPQCAAVTNERRCARAFPIKSPLPSRREPRPALAAIHFARLKPASVTWEARRFGCPDLSPAACMSSPAPARCRPSIEEMPHPCCGHACFDRHNNQGCRSSGTSDVVAARQHAAPNRDYCSNEAHEDSKVVMALPAARIARKRFCAADCHSRPRER